MNITFNITSVKPLISLDTSVLQVDIGKVSQPFLKSLVEGIKPGKYELKKVGKKRSISANSYCWVLCDEIAKKLRSTKEEIYRRAVGEVGVYSELFFAGQKQMAEFDERWKRNGLGWFIKPTGKHTAQLYYGSSVYQQDEMNRLVDWLVDEAQGLGIPTMSDDELNLMIGRWERDRKRMD